MKLIILSDIHANFEALSAVLDDIENKKIKNFKYCILGDLINYGMRPNETINTIKNIQEETEILLAGNHEMAIFGFEDNRFSSTRGKEALNITKKLIKPSNLDYIDSNLSKNFIRRTFENKKYLFIHGSLSDTFWGKINEKEIENYVYKEYDVVFSGHTHKPHFIEKYYEANNVEMNNKKKTIFINPGSVGQPRNHNTNAQYAIWDTVTCNLEFCNVSYDIKHEQSLYDRSIDEYYKIRIGLGI